MKEGFEHIRPSPEGGKEEALSPEAREELMEEIGRLEEALKKIEEQPSYQEARNLLVAKDKRSELASDQRKAIEEHEALEQEIKLKEKRLNFLSVE